MGINIRIEKWQLPCKLGNTRISQEILLEQADGSIILDIDTSGSWDLRRWVLSFGMEAEVLEPEELRKKLPTD
ncbi:MAG: WYL domain-containing protein [Proteobacteria bacterium]|nr:WYL domain-containing protein [Pseudomonadota bacterium]